MSITWLARVPCQCLAGFPLCHARNTNNLFEFEGKAAHDHMEEVEPKDGWQCHCCQASLDDHAKQFFLCSL
jgi:hypothetical protein